MNTVRRLCERVIVLDHGMVVFDGPTEEGIKVYLKQDDETIDKPYTVLSNRTRPNYSNNEVRMDYVEMIGKEDIVFKHGERIHFKLGWTSLIDLEDIRIQLIISHEGSGVCSTFSPPFTSAQKDKKYITYFDLDTSLFAEGKYRMTIALYHGDSISGSQHLYDYVSGACSFQVIPKISDNQYIRWYHPGWGSVRLPDITAAAEEDNG